MTSAIAIYSGALRRAARGGNGVLRLLGPSGRFMRHLDTARWHGGLTPADHSVVRRCQGPTLDVGCGPGRFAAALRRGGITALGIDVSPAAVRLARQTGADAVLADVFESLPGEGAWRHALLTDGNIGIGGDPARLLHRCARLVALRGTVLVEVEAPGTVAWSGPVSITDERRVSETFRWAVVGVDQLAVLAEQAGLRIAETWSQERRWFACLSR